MAQPQRSHPPQRRPAITGVYRSGGKRRRKNARKKQLITLAVMSGGVLALFLAALLITTLTKAKEPPVVISSIIPASVPVASVPAASVSAGPAREATPFDEAGLPPLYNYQHFIADDYLSTIELVDVGNGQKMESRAAEAYKAMQKAAAEDGITLVPLSGYRSHQRQTNNYNASIQRYLDQGLSREEAVRRTEGYYAIPGSSEHEAGLAMDVGDAAAPGANINDGFANTKAYAWLQDNAVKFGFILRYGSDTFDITRINYEPWHYRYVGANHAEIINEKGITLEEYIQQEGSPA